jgi:hypothetical protein
VLVQFAQVSEPGFTSIRVGPGWSIPSEMRAVTGQSVDLGTEAVQTGLVHVAINYDDAMVQAPENMLKLMRYDAERQVWEDITTSRDPVLNRVEGTCSSLSSFVLTEPWTSLSADELGSKLRFALLPGMPNPTNGRTTMRFALSRRGHAKMTIHDIQGRQVAVVVDGSLEAGNHSIVWNGLRSDGGRLAAGIYMVKLHANEGSLTSKLVIVN